MTIATTATGIRLDVDGLAPHMSKAMNALDAASRKTSVEAPLLELVRLRASQINGCTPATPAPVARASGGSPPCRCGGRRRSSPPGNGRRWSSPRP
jgi:hypothetical protein